VQGNDANLGINLTHKRCGGGAGLWRQRVA